jgi:two-component system response regulator NreC
MPSSRVLLAEPNSLVRSLLRVALSQPGVTVIGETSTLDELLELCASERPDVVVTNVDLDGGSIDRHVHALNATGTRVLVLTDEPSPERLTGLLSSGVSGYLLRDMGAESLVDAVHHVAAGQIALHPVAASTVVDQWKRLRDGGPDNDRLTLTPRELDVLAAMADGLSTKAIARRLGVAIKTVENHKTRVFDKLGVRSQAHAVATAIGQGLLTSSPRVPEGV